ncbi:helix-turn-helix domain-containing protein [Maritalea mediterranea]|uniref:Helix-turn-helix domain-containing protein n=1 Tax=Maritalea mediterranea TaxID=2909667 RepID=A0ABS9E805_9HYPH|nr:helix-turn-helix domain-containing protein [Maritalea mediterranea]MCF4098332.1 helix-turn-helix domain-containing protein [Maritalea mediterranea]
MIDIAQLSKKTGLPASKLRYYDEVGLIQSVGRKGLKRLFDADAEIRLSLIALGQNAGFSLDEIKAMFGAGNVAAPQVQIDRDKLRDKANEIDRKIERLVAMRDGLLHAADCPHPDHLHCPTFQRLMKVASYDRARRG